eukprot:TRINITY_DN576_c0_g3_i3.p1 TRINITY_DN576_c0_g3~~TRINITY_DN576_c0_g3_i3.p1  ORF type:complete len:519 (+),score=118.07 TRINITY_DN576_c0_g3_i3:502-2058(+)
MELVTEKNSVASEVRQHVVQTLYLQEAATFDIYNKNPIANFERRLDPNANIWEIEDAWQNQLEQSFTTVSGKVYECRLVFKSTLELSNGSLNFDDNVFLHLLYIQLRYCIGRCIIICTKEQAAELAAMQMHIDAGPYSSKDLRINIKSFLPTQYKIISDQQEIQNLTGIFQTRYKNLQSESAESVKTQYVQFVLALQELGLELLKGGGGGGEKKGEKAGDRNSILGGGAPLSHTSYSRSRKPSFSQSELKELNLVRYSRPQFGVRLDKLMEYSPADEADPYVPKFFAQATNWLITVLEATPSTEPGTTNPIEGLGRISAVKSDLDELENKLNQGEDFDFSSVEAGKAHAIVGLLKKFLRELPIPLLTFDLGAQLLKSLQAGGAGVVNSTAKGSGIKVDLASSGPVTKTQVDDVKRILSRLPDYHKRVLSKFLSFLSQLLKHEAKTKMDLKNLSICFCQCFLWKEGAGLGDIPLDMNSVAFAKTLQAITSILISSFIDIKPVLEVPHPPPSSSGGSSKT